MATDCYKQIGVKSRKRKNAFQIKIYSELNPIDIIFTNIHLGNLLTTCSVKIICRSSYNLWNLKKLNQSS